MSSLRSSSTGLQDENPSLWLEPSSNVVPRSPQAALGCRKSPEAHPETLGTPVLHTFFCEGLYRVGQREERVAKGTWRRGRAPMSEAWGEHWAVGVPPPPGTVTQQRERSQGLRRGHSNVKGACWVLSLLFYGWMHLHVMCDFKSSFRT